MHRIKASAWMTFPGLRTERQRYGWTQAQLAEALGVNIRTVRRWEQGKSIPYPCYRRRLSLLFGKTILGLGLLKHSGKKSVQSQSLA